MSGPDEAHLDALRASLKRLAEGASNDGELDGALQHLDALSTELREQRALRHRADERLSQILDVVLSMATFDYSKRADIGTDRDEFDALALGINMMAEELTASTSLVTNILNAMDDALLTSNSAGAIVNANGAACRMLDYSVDELCGLELSSVLTSRAAQRGLDALLRDLAAHDEEAAAITKDGRAIPISLSVSPMKNAAGELIGAVCVARDITERKRHEQERMRQEEERKRLEEAVRAQADAILQMSTPLIPITAEIVVMPLVGSVDDARAHRIVETLLEGVTRSRARVAILDITGVPVVDTQIALGVLRAVSALRLVGALTVLTGVRPEVAQTIVALDVDMSGIAVEGTLRSGITRATRMLRATGIAARSLGD